MFGVTVDADAMLLGLAARIPATATAGPGSFTKLRLDIQGLLPPLAIARNFGCNLRLLDIGCTKPLRGSYPATIVVS
jgi:hypothetical protein